MTLEDLKGRAISEVTYLDEQLKIRLADGLAVMFRCPTGPVFNGRVVGGTITLAVQAEDGAVVIATADGSNIEFRAVPV